MIKGVKEEDGGLYTCQARNAGGIRQVTVELTVEGKNVSNLAQIPFWKLFLLVCNDLLHPNFLFFFPDCKSKCGKLKIECQLATIFLCLG